MGGTRNKKFIKMATTQVHYIDKPKKVTNTPVKNGYSNGSVPCYKNSETSKLEKIPEQGILDFYKGTSLFVTGITGFVGKTLLEKLLRTCTGVEKVYVLVRPKKGSHGEERLKKILASPAFDRIKETNPEALQKVVVIAGDVSHEDLGISEEDRQTLTENINIVFHSAASVRFNEPLKDAIMLNTFGTKTILELSKSMKKLKSFVYVSTAFSNADKLNQKIEETVYAPLFDPNGVINCVQTLPPEMLNSIESQIRGNHPNNYTFSKSLSEALVKEYSSSLPITIVRPSIVTASWKEPVPGWVDSMAGATGVVSAIGRGTVRSILCNGSNKSQLIPVDILANALIAAAWRTYENKSDTLTVYNVTNGDMNPLTWKEFSEISEYYVKQYPSKYMAWYPGHSLTQNRFIFWFIQIFLQYILAVLVDLRNSCFSKKHQGLMMYSYRKFVLFLGISDFFRLNDFYFAQENYKALINNVKKAHDGNLFNVEIRGLDWKSYVNDYAIGIRKYVLKEDMSSLPTAKTTLNRLYWLHKLFKVGVAYLLVKSFLWIVGVNLWASLRFF